MAGSPAATGSTWWSTVRTPTRWPRWSGRSTGNCGARAGEYFKLDALRHLRYEGYNSYGGHFARKGVERAEASRSCARSVREEIGRDRFLTACWGVRPELVGIADACRLGTDGFSFAGLAQYNSFNNVVWRNDPDHIELSEREAWRSTMLTSLTGSLFLLTDKPER